MSMKRIQCFSWFAKHPGDVWASELHSSASNATGEMGETKLEKMRWMSEIMQPIVWYQMVFLKWNYIVLQNIALHCTSMALYAYFIVYCMIPQIVYLQYIWSYIVLYCIELYCFILQTNWTMINPSHWYAQMNSLYELITPNQSNFIPSPVSELPLKEEKTCEFIQETRSWNNSLAVTDASQGKSNSNSMDYHTAWSWTWKLKNNFPTVPKSFRFEIEL